MVSPSLRPVLYLYQCSRHLSISHLQGNSNYLCTCVLHTINAAPLINSTLLISCHTDSQLLHNWTKTQPEYKHSSSLLTHKLTRSLSHSVLLINTHTGYFNNLYLQANVVFKFTVMPPHHHVAPYHLCMASVDLSGRLVVICHPTDVCWFNTLSVLTGSRAH